MITQIKFVSIPTRDQSRALKFYTEKLGFEVATDQQFDAKQRWIELRIANSPLYAQRRKSDRALSQGAGSRSERLVRAEQRGLCDDSAEFGIHSQGRAGI